jgi:hypothetical protein
MADLPNSDLQSAHVPFDAIRGLLGIGILLFYNWFFKLKDLPLDPPPFVACSSIGRFGGETIRRQYS